MVDELNKPKVGATLKSFANALFCVAERMTEGQQNSPWEGRRLSGETDGKDSLGRHMLQYLRGDDDEDHLTAVVTNALIELELRERNKK